MKRRMTVVAVGLLLPMLRGYAAELKVHGVFSSNMVLQRQKPIEVWGRAPVGQTVTVTFGDEGMEATAEGDAGRWEVTFPSREASPEPCKLVVKSGGKSVEKTNIVTGDVWIMNGQSNMAWGPGKTMRADLEIAQAHAPLLRQLRINPNERETLQTDLPAKCLPDGGWVVASPEAAGGFPAIGYSFGIRLQRALQIPIGIIDNARGGASIESLVPLHEFDDHPVAAACKAHLDKRIAEFDPAKRIEEEWQRQLARLRSKGVA